MVFPMNKEKFRELTAYATAQGIWLDWQTHMLRVGDPTVFGGYAHRPVRAIYYKGEIVYEEEE